MRLSRAALHTAAPVLAAAFPILSLYSSNLQYPFSEVGPCLAWAMGGALVVYLLFAALFRESSRASLFAVLFVALFFSFKLFSPAEKGEIDELKVYVDAALEIAYGLLWVAFGLLLFRARKWQPLEAAARGVAVVALCVAAAPLPQIASGLVQRQRAAPVAPPVAVAETTTAGPRPDVYYIVLDSFGRRDVLDALYGVDNGEFVAGLEARGFFVAGRSRANYLITHMSLASALNYRYLDEDLEASSGVVLARCKTLIMDSAVSRFLRARGYRYVNIRSGYLGTSPNKVADVEEGMPGLELQEFQLWALRMTPLWKWRLQGDAYHQRVHQRRILFQMDALPRVAAQQGPKFVLAHIVAPHPPFVFDRDGGTLEIGSVSSMVDGDSILMSRAEYARGYREQLLFVSRRILEAIDGILAAYPAGERPVIVLQGDHGSGMYYHFERLDRAYLPERLPILNALLLPADRSFDLRETMTPVNSFRVIFNGLFDAGLPLEPDRSYYVPLSRPGEFVELSESDAELSSRPPPK